MLKSRIGRLAVAPALLIAACGRGGDVERIEADGSSTVYPITEAVAEEFSARAGGAVRVTVGFSGTGGGFKRFCAGETTISNASRPISAGERELCAQNGVDYVELPVAIDGLAVVVNPQNELVQCLTVDELRRIWEPGSRVSRWSDVRPGLPDEPLKLYGPGTNSGTFDYFTHAIVGTERASRTDFTASEDDNVLVQGVEGDRAALGYFGYAYYAENAGRLRVVAVDNGTGCVTPSPETVRSGDYEPLARPLFIYVNAAALERPGVAEFVRFYMQHAAELVPQVGYVPLEDARYGDNIRQLEQRVAP